MHSAYIYAYKSRGNMHSANIYAYKSRVNMHSAFPLTPYFMLHLSFISSSVPYFFFFPKNSPGIV